VEYRLAWETYLQREKRPDGTYILCADWGSIHNVGLLERDRHHGRDVNEYVDLERNETRQGR